MASYSAQTLINNALTNLGILEQGGTPSVSDSNEALARLNYMIQQWRLQDQFIWSIATNTYPLTAGTAQYLIGPGGSGLFLTTRPTFIQKASIVIGGTGPTITVKLISQQEYRDIPDQTATAQYPMFLYYDRASPTGTLFLWPTPSNSGASLILDTWQQLNTYAALNTTADLPDGYAEAITNALAVRLMPMFGVAINSQVGQLTSDLAKQAEAAIAALNVRARGLVAPSQDQQIAEQA
jgi:hypothetical protein